MSDKAKKKIARLVARRYYSEKELRDKLANYNTEEIEAAISWGKEQGFIDDLRFARAFVHDALLLKPQGKRLLTTKLAEKGIKGTLSESVLKEEYPKELEAELALKLALKYAAKIHEDDEQIRLKRLCGYLLRRGFPESLVYSVAKETVLLDTSRDEGI